jgi:hypothetical protein
MRRILGAAALVLVAGTTAACGGEAPDDASSDDFCETVQADGLNSDEFGEVETWAEDMKETGTPENIPDDARAGFERVIQAVEDSSDTEELEKADEDFEGEDEDNINAFFEYAAEECGAAGEG